MSNNRTKSKYSDIPIFVQVIRYCALKEAATTIVPFLFVLLSLLLKIFGANSIAEFTWKYIAISLFLLVPVIITLKQIETLKKSFPRDKNENKVILSVFFLSAVSFILDIILFILSCYLNRIYPLSFKSAGYIRDMIASSFPAMTIFFIAVLFVFCLVSLMTTTAFFIGEASKKKLKFTLSCTAFLLMYIVLLVIFVFSYFTATFIDIKTLENIQIANSFFNSSMLCSFVILIFISIIALPILYILNYKALKKLTVNDKKK